MWRVITPVDSGPSGIQLLVAMPRLAIQDSETPDFQPLPFWHAAVIGTAPIAMPAQPCQAAAGPSSHEWQQQQQQQQQVEQQQQASAHTSGMTRLRVREGSDDEDSDDED